MSIASSYRNRRHHATNRRSSQDNQPDPTLNVSYQRFRLNTSTKTAECEQRLTRANERTLVNGHPLGRWLIASSGQTNPPPSPTAQEQFNGWHPEIKGLRPTVWVTGVGKVMILRSFSFYDPPEDYCPNVGCIPKDGRIKRNLPFFRTFCSRWFCSVEPATSRRDDLRYPFSPESFRIPTVRHLHKKPH